MLIIVNNCIVCTSLSPQRTHIFQLLLYNLTIFYLRTISKCHSHQLKKSPRVNLRWSSWWRYGFRWRPASATPQPLAFQIDSDIDINSPARTWFRWIPYHMKHHWSRLPILKPQTLQTWSQTGTGRVCPGPGGRGAFKFGDIFLQFYLLFMVFHSHLDVYQVNYIFYNINSKNVNNC